MPVDLLLRLRLAYFPLGQPPLGDLRWELPQKLPNSSRVYNSTRLGPGTLRSVPTILLDADLANTKENSGIPIACLQYVSSAHVFWNKYAPPNPLFSLGERRDQDEDCLSLAVWTPSHANQSSKLPVPLFVRGGGGLIGDINIPSQLPEQLVSRSQEHIVVTINYRVSIFRSKSNQTSKTKIYWHSL
jgi:carboxylesterase type B